jgi:hypothetical protein
MRIIAAIEDGSALVLSVLLYAGLCTFLHRGFTGCEQHGCPSQRQVRKPDLGRDDAAAKDGVINVDHSARMLARGLWAQAADVLYARAYG